MEQKYITYSPAQTKDLAKKLGQSILKFPVKEKKAIFIALQGELGSGKTTFLQGFAKGLGIKEKILSPTFVLIKKYQVPDTEYNFYHIDCYRIKKAEDLSSLDLEKIFLNPQNIIAVEWAKKIKKILPKNIIILNFKFKKEKEREIKIKSSTACKKRLQP